MMNYIKSELYRALHDKGLCFSIILLAFLSVLLNAVLAWAGQISGESFQYNTTSFSYSNLVANPMLFAWIGTGIGVAFYEGNRKNGNLKNTIAYGISRTKIFAGQCIVTTIISITALIAVLAAYVLSAVLLLEHSGPVTVIDLLTEIPAVFLVAVACLISGIVLMEVSGRNTAAIAGWLLIWTVIPKAFYYAGLKFEIFHRVSMWMPQNFFGSSNMFVNLSQSVTVWGTAEGLAKCIISGMAGIIIFSLAGVVLLRKKEL